MVPLQQQQLLYNGREMKNFEKLSALGVKDEDLVMMVSSVASASTNDLSFNPDGSSVNPGAFQQHIQRVSNLIGQLFQTDPELAQAIVGNDLNKLQDLLRVRHRQRSELRRQEEEELALLHADPFDIEAQKKIEAAIRQKGIDENWAAALEYNPEGFARVVMLYVDMEVNSVPLKAFVDSGAQSTIISKSCAERCGLLRLLDQRYKGIAHGVGQSEILGRIHVAPIKIGNVFYPCSFVVLDSPNMEFLFGLDMLRKHQKRTSLLASLMKKGIQSKHPAQELLSQLPQLRRMLMCNLELNLLRPDFEAKVAKLVELGFAREMVIEALKLCDGNEEQAAGILFGG
ncbi:hypothetical protein DITRI_Ditri14bG0154000 [Diplodiscus trichospermus]